MTEAARKEEKEKEKHVLVSSRLCVCVLGVLAWLTDWPTDAKAEMNERSGDVRQS